LRRIGSGDGDMEKVLHPIKNRMGC
jgi:hypothetical protein